MWWVFLAAIGLAIFRDQIEAIGLVGAMIVSAGAAAIAFAGLVLIWFILVPKWTLKLAGGDPNRRRRLLLWVVHTPFPWPQVKASARFLLAVLDQVARRYEEAEAMFRAILRDGAGDLDIAFESLVWHHLADTAEALGHPEEADAERDRATRLLDRAGNTFLSLQAQGKMLAHEHRDAEAYEAFERGLALVPAGEKALQVTFMAQLVLSSFNAGRLTDTLRWADEALGADPQGPVSEPIRRMAAFALRGLGRLDEADSHLRLAIEMASSASNQAKALALLSGIELARGDLEGAERSAGKALGLHSEGNAVPWVTLSQVEMIRGSFDAAIAAKQRASIMEISHRPSSNRHTAAVFQREIAGLHAESGRLDLALELIREAELELAQDRRQKVHLDAQAAVVHALRQERDLALARIHSADAGRKLFPENVRYQRQVLLPIGRAALEIELPEQAEVFLRSCLALEPAPVTVPQVLYYLASCRRCLGDVEGGRALDRSAASSHFGTLHERMARERLETEGILV
jgi:tetratricopeptide (TPR) repeat protein